MLRTPDEAMTIGEQTVLLVSDDPSLWAAARRRLEVRDGHPRVAAVCSMSAAHRILEATAPAVILLEEAAVETEPEGPLGKVLRLDAAVSSLAIHAPVVVIGPAEREEELSVLIAAGVADYLVRSANCLTTALERVERRLQVAQDSNNGVARQAKASPDVSDASNREDFGGILRHELNNPLTGILGNAELLLAEMRRQDDGQFSKSGQQRAETIAALAVRMRETVRRLSERWESHLQSH
jgi:signal transduction histidine kinase